MAKHKVAVVQWTAQLLDKDHNLRRIDEWTSLAAAQGSSLIVFPECSNAGYLYASKAEAELAADSIDSAWVDGVRAVAFKYALYVAVGFTEKDPNTGNIYNSVVCCDPKGEIAAVYRKHFLVSFDRYFFDPGNQGFPYVDSELGRFGFLICGDARIPELGRNNGLNGIDILIYPTAWGSRDQLEINIKARGIENGSWVLAADKTGVERGFSYPGKSFIMAPDGTIVAQAAETGEELLIAEIDTDAQRLFAPRRHPELYKSLLQEKPAERKRESCFHPAVLSLEEADLTRERIVERLGEAKILGAQCCFVIIPEEREAAAEAFRQAVEAVGIAAICCGRSGRSASMMTPDGISCRQQEIHSKEQGEPWFLLEISGVKVGVLIGSDGTLPEMARCMSFDGASLIYWLQSPPLYEAHKLLAQARAIENQLYVVAVHSDTGYSEAVAPDGSVLWNPPFQEGTVLHWHLPLSRASGGESLPMTDILNDRPYSAVQRLAN